MLFCYCGITEQSITEGSFAFDLSGQTQSQCELTVGNRRLLDPVVSRVCANSFGGDGYVWWKFAEEIQYRLTRNYRI